jgi:mRNA-degrading endonuclease RelE of RelBE toxin-antitoxin system
MILEVFSPKLEHGAALLHPLRLLASVTDHQTSHITNSPAFGNHSAWRKKAAAQFGHFTPVIGRDFPDHCPYPSLAYTEGVTVMIAVVETEEFLADVKGVLSEDEHDDLILYVALHPEVGDLIPKTGGLRKLRWAAKGRGKRGGSRVIYYFHNIDVPLFLMAIFAKNIQTDLSTRQRAALTRQLRGLKSDWEEKKLK